MTEKINKITKKVMKKIKKHEVKMKPRVYFVMGSALMGVGLTSLLLLTVFLMGVVFFKLRMQGLMDHGMMMSRVGWWRFLPWKMMVTTLTSFSGGLWLLRGQGKGYKVSFFWMIIGAVMTVVSLGFLMDKMGVNNHLQRMHRLKPLYRMRVDQGEEMDELRRGIQIRNCLETR